jgi:hypothetical protein
VNILGYDVDGLSAMAGNVETQAFAALREALFWQLD